MPDQTYQSKVYRKQGGREQVVASGGTLTLEAGSTLKSEGVVDLSSAAVTLPGSLGRGYMDLGDKLFGARQAASGETISSGSTAPTLFFGGLLMPDGAPALKMLSTADPILSLQWASAIVVPVALPPISLPEDLSTAGGLTIELFGEAVGTATTAYANQSFKINARSGVGDTEMGATHPNLTTTPSWKGITLASGDINATAPLNIILTPQTHAGRQLNLYGMRASYTKKTS